MFYPVVLLRRLRVVPSVHGSYKIARNTSYSLKIDRLESILHIYEISVYGKLKGI